MLCPWNHFIRHVSSEVTKGSFRFVGLVWVSCHVPSSTAARREHCHFLAFRYLPSLVSVPRLEEAKSPGAVRWLPVQLGQVLLVSVQASKFFTEQFEMLHRGLGAFLVPS